MIISPGRRYIFVHIPKTGGTAMALALEARAMADDVLIGDTPQARRRKGRLKALTPAGRLWKHATLADIEGIIDREAFDGFLIFTLVRNPWDRLVSYWSWLRTQRFAHPAVALARDLPFAAFLAHPMTQGALSANPYPRYVTDGAGAERRALFLRIEHMAEDVAPLIAHLGFAPDLPRANASARPRDWRPLYDADSAALVARLCGPDIRRFGYRFDPTG